METETRKVMPPVAWQNHILLETADIFTGSEQRILAAYGGTTTTKTGRGFTSAEKLAEKLGFATPKPVEKAFRRGETVGFLRRTGIFRSRSYERELCVPATVEKVSGGRLLTPSVHPGVPVGSATARATTTTAPLTSQAAPTPPILAVAAEMPSPDREWLTVSEAVELGDPVVAAIAAEMDLPGGTPVLGVGSPMYLSGLVKLAHLEGRELAAVAAMNHERIPVERVLAMIESGVSEVV
ncbi:hypothetical protein [Frankia sp. QA3]|uniref:hypothetical protein n=1 Tax=Frankia sp. QA3 TaxID=710111 RepID=UPI000269B8B3|nr:hypothetical protein [Frankia sp. QA3]EIV90816.1 hypothetical protein FraQA3DRAFT_0222 [Frankia sp. QA3]